MMRLSPCLLLALLAPACADPSPTEPALSGIIELARWRDANGVFGGSLFAILADHGEMFGPPTATDGDCVYTERQHLAGWDMGTLTLEGTTEPVQITRTQGAYFGGDLQYPDGGELRVQTSGGRTSGFTAAVRGPLPLADLRFPSALSRTTPAPIRWTPGTGDEVAIQLAFGSLGVDSAIRCRVADTGELAIPPTLLAMVSSSADGFTFHVARRTVTPGSTSDAEIDVVAGDELHSPPLTLEP